MNPAIEKPGKRRMGAAAALICLLVALIYGNSLNCSWHFDDYKNIVGNENVHLTQWTWTEIVKSFQGIPGVDMKRPLPYFSFALNHYAHGFDVVGFHLVNILIHAVTAILLFLFLYRILTLPLAGSHPSQQAYAIALLASILWVVNPVQVSAVTYIVQRMTSMAAMFYLIAMLSYLEARTAKGKGRRILFFGVCLAGALGAVLSKANASMLPIVLLVFELLLIRGADRKNCRQIALWIAFPFCLVLLAGFYFTNVSDVLRGYEERPFTLLQRILTEPRVLLFYMSLLLYPQTSRLTLLHDFELSQGLLDPWTTLPALLVVLGLVGYALAVSGKRPLLAFSILFFFLNHAIEGSFIPLEIVYEHRNYLPSMFFFVPIAVFLVKAMHRYDRQKGVMTLLAVLVATVVAVQGLGVHILNGIYRDEESLWNDNAMKSPGLLRPHHNLAVVRLAAGRIGEAHSGFLAALAGRDDAGLTNKAHTHYYLGLLYRITGNNDLAEQQFLKAVEWIPFYVDPWQALAETMAARKEYVQAHRWIDRAISLDPKRGDLYLTKAYIFMAQGRMPQALENAIHALKYNGNAAQAYSLVAEAYQVLQNAPVSEHFRKVARHAI